MVREGQSKNSMSGSLYALVLAGGSGTRLWPFSRRESPKQFLDLRGEMTLFQETISRLEARVPPERMVFITSKELEVDVRDQLRQSLGTTGDKCRVVAEPVGRNTAPAILLGAWIVYLLDPEGVLLAAPSDHVITDGGAFIRAIDLSLPTAHDRIVTYGIKPTRPETGYGYIRTGEETGSVFEIAGFEEKPNMTNARRFFLDNRYLWNSGIFLSSVKNLIGEARMFCPDIMSLIEEIDPVNLDGIEKAYGKMRALSFDYGIMEKTARGAVLPVSMGWSDIGSWDSYYETREKDGSGNVLGGDVISLDNEGCLILSKGGLVAASGMEDSIIIQTEDAVLVCPRGRSQEVRKVVERLDQEDRVERLGHPTVRRPWGAYTVLTEREKYKVKKLVVDPGHKMSLQKHDRRSEHWVVVRGEIVVTRGEEEMTLRPNEGVTIPIGMLHRIENRSSELAELVEVQLGDYVGEDDIVRYDDGYGRIKE